VTHLVVDGDEVLKVDPRAHLDPETHFIQLIILLASNLQDKKGVDFFESLAVLDHSLK